MNLSYEFDQMNDGYTDKMERFVPYYQKMIIGIPEYIPNDFTPKRILDLGSGNGNVTFLMLKKFPDADYLLIDASSEMLKECAERFQDNPNIQFQEGWFQELDFPPSSFDIVTAGFSLHHLNSEEKQAIFKKIQKWLCPGGYLSISDLWVDKKEEPIHSKLLLEWESIAKKQGTSQSEWDWLMDHYEKFDRPDSFDNQMKWLTDAGFDKVKCNWQIKTWMNVWARK